jgi:hypothetical protein
LLIFPVQSGALFCVRSDALLWLTQRIRLPAVEAGSNSRPMTNSVSPAPVLTVLMICGAESVPPEPMVKRRICPSSVPA